MLHLPWKMWVRLAMVLNQIEAEGSWPESLTHWRIVYIPKETGGEGRKREARGEWGKGYSPVQRKVC